MATLKMMGGGTSSTKDPLSMTRSFKEYFLCCFNNEKNKKMSKEREAPEGGSEETRLRGSPVREDASGSSRPPSKVPTDKQANEMKEVLNSALSQASKEESSSRPRSAMSVKRVTIDAGADGRASRGPILDAKLKEDRESISSRLSRFLTSSPKPKEDQTMGNETSIQQTETGSTEAVGEDKTALPETIEEKIFSDSIVNGSDSDPSKNNLLSSTPVPHPDQNLVDTEAEKQLFDVSDLQKDEHTFAGYSCGSVFVTLKREQRACRVVLTIHEAKDIPSKDRGGHSNSQIHVVLLPEKKIRHRTKVLPGDNPVFNEPFDFKIKDEKVAESSVRLRLYGIVRLKKNRLVGEIIVPFSPQYLNDTPVWLALEPRTNLRHGDSATSLNSVNQSESEFSLVVGDSAELMLGLAYNSMTGRMSVEVVKGSNFKNSGVNRPPDTYVKIALMAPNQQEISRSKTTVRRGQPNPLFKETFMFQVPQFQLADVSLLVSVFAIKSLKRKEMIGWFTMGQTSSSDDDLSHWTAMLESKGEQVSRWHNLLDP